MPNKSLILPNWNYITIIVFCVVKRLENKFVILIKKTQQNENIMNCTLVYDSESV